MSNVFLFLSGLFNWVVMTSLMASFLVVIILLVKLVLKDNLKLKWQYAIWFVLIARLMMPFAPESSFSMFNVFSILHKLETVTNVSNIMDYNQSIPVSNQSNAEKLGQSMGRKTSITATNQTILKNPSLVQQNSITSSKAKKINIGLSIHTGVLFVWLLGMLSLAWYIVHSNRKIVRKLIKYSPVKNKMILSVFEHCKKELRVKRKIPLIISPSVDGPTLYGFIFPAILLPEKGLEKFTDNEFRYIFLHELVHYKRKDIFLNWTMMLLLLLHWFNPLLWYAYKKMREDQELSCDAIAVSHIHPNEVKEYGYTIIKLIESYSESSWIPAFANFSADKSQLKRRIKMITFFKKNSYKWSIIGITVLILLSGCALTNGKTTGDKKSNNVVIQLLKYGQQGNVKSAINKVNNIPKDQLDSTILGVVSDWHMYKNKYGAFPPADLRIVMSLLDRGANPNVKNKDSEPLIFLSVQDMSLYKTIAGDKRTDLNVKYKGQTIDQAVKQEQQKRNNSVTPYIDTKSLTLSNTDLTLINIINLSTKYTNQSDIEKLKTLYLNKQLPFKGKPSYKIIGEELISIDNSQDHQMVVTMNETTVPIIGDNVDGKTHSAIYVFKQDSNEKWKIVSKD